jgi:3,4-dihydroxy-2-butanone 4-phosphate synthase
MGAPSFNQFVAMTFKRIRATMATAAGTGAVTQNTVAGKVKIAAGAASVVVTNELCTANSVVLAVLQSNDTTATFVKGVVPTNGSFTITVNANATATTVIGYLIINSTE